MSPSERCVAAHSADHRRLSAPIPAAEIQRRRERASRACRSQREPIGEASDALRVWEQACVIDPERVRRGQSVVAPGSGSGSLEQDGLVTIVAMKKEEKTCLVHWH